jgi:tetratricopeptide (TPR) repeat protein
VEEYLTAPFGVYADDGVRVAGSLREWGEGVFGFVFGDPGRRAVLERVRGRAGGGTGVEVVFRSGSAEWLGLPWELMWEPGRPAPLVLDGVGMSRQLPTGLAAAFPVETARGRLRVLMVIARPKGPRDVPYRMVARPLLKRLEAVRGRVEVSVLRPPTVEQLGRVVQEAAAAGDPFQVVHFDGHGVSTADGGGVLVFEDGAGGEDLVPAGQVAQVLGRGRVPVVVVNACQSAAVGKQLEAAVATRLMQGDDTGGAAVVVAMAYTVYAVAAAEFMAAFYEALFTGATVTAAVTAGRARLAAAPLRPSPKGPMPLQDWLVPVLYQRREVTFPDLTVSRPAGRPSLDAMLNQARHRTTGDHIGDHTGENPAISGAGLVAVDPWAPVGVFVGRDRLFAVLEATLVRDRVVVLSGTGGTGKSEAVKAFGRWWRDTNGVDDPALIVWCSFEPGVAAFGLDQVVNSIGLQVYGTDFAQLDPGQREQAVLDLLDRYRVLVVWDNFESAHSMPDPTLATPPLDPAEQRRLQGFLARVQAGRGTVLVTSRTSEDWLGSQVRRIEVGGLVGDEANSYTDQLLAGHPAAQQHRKHRDFADLLDWLDGHPLSMRLTLPQLDTHTPHHILADLQGTTNQPPPAPATGTIGASRDSTADSTGDRMGSLAACVTYSLRQLDTETQGRLVAASLFHGVVDADVLNHLSQDERVPARFAGIDRDGWGQLLDAAERVGLVTGLGSGMWRLHPALPGQLATRWQAAAGDAFPAERAAAEDALTAAYARLGLWLQQQIEGGDPALAYTVIGLQRRTMGHTITHALHHTQYQLAAEILVPLNEYWESRGLSVEARGWVDRVRHATEHPPGSPPDLTTPAGELWLFTVGAQASRDLNAGRLDDAQATYQGIATTLEHLPDTRPARSHLATSYHQLGMIQQARGNLDAAQDLYRMSLAITQELGDRARMASTYHQLGRVEEDRGNLDAAIELNRKALVIKEELGDRLGMAESYHQLGNDDYMRGNADDAQGWYLKSLVIKEELAHRPGMAITYHQLGMLEHDRGNLNAAQEWYLKALAITEDLAHRPGMAITYHQLGMLEQSRGNRDAAEQWYLKSLAISNEVENKPGMATSLGQLGLLAEDRGRLGEALAWTVRAAALFPEFPHSATRMVAPHLQRLTRQLGLPVLQRVWQDTTGQSLPEPIREYVQADSVWNPETRS